MRILHIITGLNKGGAETLLCNLCQFDKEHAHTIISLSNVKDSQSLSSMHNFSLYSLNFPIGKVRVLGLFILSPQISLSVSHDSLNLAVCQAYKECGSVYKDGRCSHSKKALVSL